MTNLVIKQGADAEIRIEDVKDANDVLITNWSGFSFKAQVRDRASSATVLHEWTSQGATPNATFSGSDVVLAVPAAVSSAWTFKYGRVDFELTGPDSKVARLDSAWIVVDPEVTR